MALSALISYLYLLAIAAHSFSVGAMVVGMRVVVGLKKLRFEVRVYAYPLDKSTVFED